MNNVEDKNKIFVTKNKVFKEGELNVSKFNELDTHLQADIIKEILSDIYSGKEIKIDNKYVLKCLKLSCDELDNNVHLPLGLLVKKEGNTITFEFQKRLSLIFIILLVAVLLLTMIGSTYSAFRYIKIANLNKDLDHDGIADLNIDTNDDESSEINIDTNGNNKPNYNIDYMGNRKKVFNVIVEVKNKKTGKWEEKIVNPINQLDDKGKCYINCDTDGDGWPDLNLDLNGDKIVDINRDTNSDGEPDLNFDLDLDGVCDLHCDTDNDNVCDKYCVNNIGSIQITQNGSSKIVGSTITSNETASLEIVYSDVTDVKTEGLMPDDQVAHSGDWAKDHITVPNKEFTIENKSTIYVAYGLKFIVESNNFTTNNFKYKVECLEDCELNSDIELPNWTPIPHQDLVFAKNLIIAPGSKQKYSISFKLEGTNQEQNEDKGKEFTATVNVVFEY